MYTADPAITIPRHSLQLYESEEHLDEAVARFLGAALASPLVGFLHEATGSLAVAMLVLAGVAVVTLVCAFAFPDRAEELKPESWADAPEWREGTVAQPAE